MIIVAICFGGGQVHWTSFTTSVVHLNTILDVSGRIIMRMAVTFQSNILVFVLQHPQWQSRSVSHHLVRVWQPLQYLQTETRISVCDIAKCFTSGSHRVSCWTDAISVIVRVDSPPQSRRCIIGSRVYSAHQCFSCWEGHSACGSVRRAREVNLNYRIARLQGGGKLLIHRDSWLKIMTRMVNQIGWWNVSRYRNISLDWILPQEVSKCLFSKENRYSSWMTVLQLASGEDSMVSGEGKVACDLVGFPIHHWE